MVNKKHSLLVLMSNSWSRSSVKNQVSSLANWNQVLRIRSSLLWWNCLVVFTEIKMSDCLMLAGRTTSFLLSTMFDFCHRLNLDATLGEGTPSRDLWTLCRSSLSVVEVPDWKNKQKKVKNATRANTDTRLAILFSLVVRNVVEAFCEVKTDCKWRWLKSTWMSLLVILDIKKMSTQSRAKTIFDWDMNLNFDLVLSEKDLDTLSLWIS